MSSLYPKRSWFVAALLIAAAAASAADQRPNIVFILIDDQRYDAFSFEGHPFLQTPHLDQLAADGVVFENAFVTTSLCSPSRASILTGQYAHRHQVLANRTALDPSLATFATTLHNAGYDTAFVGKWHMGAPDDSPRPGFEHWVSFPGQGSYRNQRLNIDGTHEETDGYLTDILTDHAVSFVRQERKRPFLLYLSHKAVHAPFIPAQRHRGSYEKRRYQHPETMADTPANYGGKPDWVRAQRNSWHGVDGMYDNSVDFDQFALDYAETLRAVDDSVGRVIQALSDSDQLDDTLIVFTSDNGFQFGEHGLIDKRTMYEASIRVPLIVHGPLGARGGRRLPQMVLNIDFAPTFIDAAGGDIPESMQGRSWLPQLQDNGAPGRDAFLYEYFWERAFPQTPTVLGVRTTRYKLMRYHGIWDRYELYDLQIDPQERNNLIGDLLTTTEVGHVEARVLGGRTPAEQSLLGTGVEDPALKALFYRLWLRLDELIDESGAAAEPNWRP
ncbi:MAG: sulfatase [Pseudomonadales bacterium]|nr:sulfatase [Pseudomonadales bacterium]MDP6825625.1 sulfatase [Pseudomonadales bacterium]